MSKSVEVLYKEREERIQKALKFEKVDRVPIVFSGPGYAPTQQGLTPKQFCMDPDAALKASLDTMDDLNAVAELDGINNMQVGCYPTLLSEIFWCKTATPGIDLPETEMYQSQEEELMKVEDYDYIIENGWDAYADIIRKKIHHPELLEIHGPWMEKHIPNIKKYYAERGYYGLCTGICEHPLELLSGARTMGKFYRDCYKMPNKVEEVIKIGMPKMIDIGIGTTKATGVPGIWTGAWRIAPSFVNPKLFDRFVWPYYSELIRQVSASGATCVMHCDANWDRELHRFLELPRHCGVLSLDGQSDIRKAREILGDHLPLLGDVPAAVLTMGTPADVRKYVKELIQDIGREGLIMNTGCDMPFNTPKENAEAYVLATHEFGS